MVGKQFIYLIQSNLLFPVVFSTKCVMTNLFVELDQTVRFIWNTYTQISHCNTVNLVSVAHA